QGPWTDIDGLCALARSLILKHAPPDALQRMVSDTCEPLRNMNLADYGPGFLAAIDRGMSLLPQPRFASIGAFAEALNLTLVPSPGAKSLPVLDTALVPASLEPVAASAPTDRCEPEQARKQVPIGMMAIVVVALIAVGAYLLRGQSADVQPKAVPPVQQVANVPVPAQEPEPVAELEPMAEEMPSVVSLDPMPPV